MTYCCGWLSKSAAFLIADGAVTSTAALIVDEHSSFGELSARLGASTVEERSLKIDAIGSTGFTFAGNVATGRALEEVYAAQIERGAPPRDALEDGIHSVGPIPRGRQIEAVIAYYDGEPRLTSYNANGCGELVDHDTIVQIGSIGAIYKELTASLLSVIPGELEPARHLAGALGLAQSFGSFDYLMEQGVGGAFAGLFVARQGVNWQRDILYVLCDASLSPERCNGVSVIVRDNILVVNSGVLGGIKVFGNTISANCDQSHLNELVRESERVFRSGKYEYVIFLNSTNQIVTVVQMNGELDHELLRIEPRPDVESDNSFGVGFVFQNKFKHLLTQPIATEDGQTPSDVSFKSVPYRAPQS